MADLFSSTRWSSEDPAIYLNSEYEIGERTATTVQVRVKLTVSAVNGYSYYGYNILSQLMLDGNYVSSNITLKDNNPSQWSNPIVTYFPSASGYYTLNAAAARTSLSATFYMDSNGGGRECAYSGTVYFPVGNTAPYWQSKTSNLTSKGTIAENVTSNTFSFGSAYDSDGDTIYYRVKYFVGGTDKGVFGSDNLTSRSFTFNPQLYIAPGQSMYFRVYCKDYASDYGSDYVQSDIITDNFLTPAAITSIDAINFDTTLFSLSRNNAVNSNGSSNITYTLSCDSCPIYNASLSSPQTQITVYRSGTLPQGMYIKFSELKATLANKNYFGDIKFTLTSTNGYGTSKTTDKTVSVDFRKNPSVPAAPTLSGQYAINGQNYFVINRRGITLTWPICTDPNGTAVTYTVQYSINSGTFKDYATALSNGAVFEPFAISSQQTVVFRIVAQNAYGYKSTGAETAPVPLHYWNPLSLSGISVDRKTNSYIVKGTATQNSSILSTIKNLTVTLIKEATTQTQISVFNQTFTNGVTKYDFSITVSTVGGTAVQESDTYPILVKTHDAVQSGVFAAADTQSEVILPRYSALFTIREKGVGINAVAGDYADFISKGTTSLYGGDVSGAADGSVNISVDKTASVDFFMGCYKDAQGVLRSSYLSPANSQYCFRQVQASFADNTVVPIRHRWFYPTGKVAVLKDAVIPTPVYLPWVNFLDSDTASMNSIRTALSSGDFTKQSGDIYLSAPNAEQRIFFNDSGTTSQNSYLYKGDSTSSTVFGLWDGTNSRSVFRYITDGTFAINRPLNASTINGVDFQKFLVQRRYSLNTDSSSLTMNDIGSEFGFAYSNATNGSAMAGPYLSLQTLGTEYMLQMQGQYLGNPIMKYRLKNGNASVWLSWQEILSTANVGYMRAYVSFSNGFATVSCSGVTTSSVILAARNQITDTSGGYTGVGSVACNSNGTVSMGLTNYGTTSMYVSIWWTK